MSALLLITDTALHSLLTELDLVKISLISLVPGDFSNDISYRVVQNIIIYMNAKRDIIMDTFHREVDELKGK